jgi:hypothetical protein
VQIYALEIALTGSKPRIWRRVRVLEDASLHTLHSVLQVTMGWTNSHLYQFEIADRRFSDPNPDGDDETEDARRVQLRDLALREGSRFSYVYDFGDWWEHDVLVEAIAPPAVDEKVPCCTAGERACPPEDVGGVPGYEQFLSALRNPRHPEHAALTEWAPPGFDPEAFDLAETNALLRRLQRPTRKRAQRTTKRDR